MVGFGEHGGFGYLGLHLPSLDVALDMADVADDRRRAVKRALRYMEDHALPVLNGSKDRNEDAAEP